MDANMRSSKRILVALSLSEGRDAAFERALVLAKTTGAELYLLHAIPAGRPFSYGAGERLRRSTALRQRAEAAGVTARTYEQEGDPAEIIVLHADARSVDLVVLGRDQRTRWARWHRKSVAEHVLRRTKRPTLVVGSNDTGDTAYEKVLVAVDMSPASTTVIDAALQWSGGSARQATVIHAIDGCSATGDGWMVPEYRGYVLGEARRELVELVRPHVAGDVRVRVAAGPTASTIRAHAADINADLIVMGRSKRVMHLGSIAIRVLRRTDRALLVIPPSAPREESIVFNRSLVVVPVDGSPETERTVRYAMGIAKLRGADVHLIQVVSRRSGTLWRAPASERRLRARLRALQPAVEQDGVFVRIVTLRGHHDGVILAYAQLNAASLIVVGHHYGSSRLWRNSSIASRLSRSSPVPVLVAPALDAVALPVRRILAAVDFTVSSAIALRTAADWSKRHGARVTVLHAMEPLDQMALSGGEASRLVHRLPAEVRVLSQRLKRKAKASGFADAEPMVVTGDACHGIVATAKDTRADLIVMGVAPRTRFDEALSGSTLRAVLRRPPVPVLVVPVVGGAHEWIDEVHEDASHAPATGAESARHAA
jgi:nucleotide-binding universal stress UspA family protein